MPLFTYKAVKAGGEEYEGTFNAPTRFELYRHVRAEGGTVVSLKEGGERKLFDFEALNAITQRIKEGDKIVFTKNLGTMIQAGLPLSRALSVLERQTKNKRLKSIFQKIESDIQGGNNFHTALSGFPKVFSPLLISMVRAGEESGKLAESLIIVADQMERAYLLKKKVRGALIYPGIIVTALIAVGALMLIYVVPVLSETFAELEVELPKSTQLVIGFSDFLTQNTILAFGILLLVIFLFIAGMRTEMGKRTFDFVLLHTPLIKKIVKDINASRTARTFSSLLSSGVEVVSALGITKDVLQNSYFKEVLERAQKEVERGQPMASAFAEKENLYPILLSEMIAVGEETGKLPEMLLQIADFYEDEVEQRTKNISTVIEPFLMIFVGAVVGFFALSMITPIYSLSSSI